MKTIKLAAILLSGATTLVPAAAIAQTNQTQTDPSQAGTIPPTDASAALPSSASPPTEAGGDTGDIIVTAQKRSENVQDVPINIMAFNGAALTQASVFSPSDLQRIAPSFRATTSIGTLATRFQIRGIGTFSNSAIEPSVATFIDGIYVPRPASIVNALLDIEAVEVLSGPQGTLFGRNASVGAVTYRTGTPINEFAVGLKSDITTGARWRNEGFVNVPLTDDIAIRVAVLADKFGGYWKDDLNGGRFGGLDTFEGRVSLKAQLAEGLSWTVRVDRQENTGDGAANTKILAGSYTPTTLARITTLQGGIQPNTDQFSRHNNSYNLNNRIDDSTWDATSDLSYTTDGDFTFRLLDGYYDWNSNQSDGDTASFSTYLLGRNLFYDSESHSHELQLISPKDKLLGGRFDFVGGLYYFHEDLGIQQDGLNGTAFCSTLVPNGVGLFNTNAANTIPGATLAARIAACQSYPNPNSRGDFDQSTRSVAAYGQATLEIIPTVEVTGGVRYTDEKKTATYVGTTFNPTGAFLAANENTALRLKDGRFTYRGNLAWHVTPDVLLFGTYSTGFKSGGFNNGIAGGVLGQQRVFQAETVENYEGGFKSQFLDRAVTFNATAFRMNIDNFQERSIVNVTSTIRNVGKVRQQGVELDAIVRPMHWLKLNGAATYIDSEIRSYPNAPRPGFCPAGRTVATAACPVTSSAATGGVQDLSNRNVRLTYNPKWTVVGGATIDGAIGSSGWHFSLNGDANYTSRQQMGSQIDNNKVLVQKGYTLFNARLTLLTPNDRYSIGVFSRNLTGKGYCAAENFQVLEGSIGVRYDLDGDGVNDGTLGRCLVGAPRVIGASFGLKF